MAPRGVREDGNCMGKMASIFKVYGWECDTTWDGGRDGIDGS
jgi:hypothetical protein